MQDQKKKPKGADTSGGARPALMVQFEHNTADVRGMRGDEALAAVGEALACAPAGSAVFIVHGTGTGRLRTQVQALLSSSREVARWEEAEGSSAGCTMAVVK